MTRNSPSVGRSNRGCPGAVDRCSRFLHQYMIMKICTVRDPSDLPRPPQRRQMDHIPELVDTLPVAVIIKEPPDPPGFRFSAA